MKKQSVTRGRGLLEKFLAKERMKIANRFILPRFRKGKILDIGCGSIPLFLLNTKFGEKYGIDPHVKEIKNIKEMQVNNNLNLIRFDIEKESKLPFKENNFDVITMLAVFEHINPDKLIDVLKEVRKVLKLGGRFILTTPCTWTDKLLRFMVKLRLVSSEEMKDHKGAYNHKMIKSYLVKAGFKENKIKSFSFAH
ncbi:class I SAM-dependent methyltransferase [Nanoarchaeota archaeon]